jgi:aminopeptidase N
MKMMVLVVALLTALSASAQKLPKTAVPSHYDITLQPDFAAESFRGNETIDIRLPQPASSITLNAVDINFEEASVTANGHTQKATVQLQPAQEMAVLHVEQALPAGAAQIHIRYTGTLKQQLRGFYVSQAGGHKYAVTQFEATDARRAFPSFDEPAMKATFRLTAVIPQEDMAISNGPIVADQPGPGSGLHTVRFAVTPKISSYLVALEVGKFQCVSGSADQIPIRVCATPERANLGRFALSAAEFIMNFYNHYYGIRYPFAKLDLVGIPDFAAGAMENAGDITFRESDLLLDPQHASVGARKEVALVVAHEMAHQWFGDLVTMEWWDDVWLNEGFATWMESKPVEAWQPQWHVAQDNVVDLGRTLNADSVQATRPIHASHVETPAEINQLFDAIAYGKAAAVLRMVESYVSPAVFRQGVNAYLQHYQYGNASAADFWNTMTEVTHKPVDRIMTGFVNQPGAPAVKLAAECSAGKTQVTLSQQRYFASQNMFQEGSSEVWQIPVCLKTSAGTPQACELLAQKRQTFTLPGCHSWVYGNAGASGYYHTLYPAPMLPQMEPAAESALSPGERVMLLGDEWAAVKVNEHGIGDYLGLAQALSQDRTADVWNQITGVLDFTGLNLLSAPDQQPYQAWVRRLLQPVAAQVGWKPKPEESTDIKMLRPEILQTLGETGGDQAVLAQAGTLARQYVSNPGAVDPSLAGMVLQMAAFNGGSELYNLYLKRMKQPATPQEYYRYLFALNSFRQPPLIEQTVRLALSPQIRTQDVPLVLVRELENPDTQQVAWEFLQQNWAMVQKRMPPADVPFLAEAVGAFCKPQLKQAAQQFFSQHPLPGTQRMLQQGLEHADNCIALKQEQGGRLAAWLQRRSPAHTAAGEGR